MVSFEEGWRSEEPDNRGDGPEHTAGRPLPMTSGLLVPADSQALSHEIESRLQRFVEASAFGEQGAIITDLDGTVVFEAQGTTLLAPTVELALEALYDLGCPLIINSLRFPLSVLQTFGADWYRIGNRPIPTVALNGSHLGLIRRADDGTLEFEEIDAFPLSPAEVAAVFARVGRLVEGGIRDILLFLYERDWRQGECVWTPDAERVEATRTRFPSASSVVSWDLQRLAAELAARELCMLCLLVDASDDMLMAYQHTRGSSFFTRAGVDKLSGARELAARLGVNMADAVGAGDTPMDRFLSGVGLALHVGPLEISYRGSVDTIRLRNAGELGKLLFHLARLERQRRDGEPRSDSTAGRP